MSNNYGPRIVTDGLVLCLDAADRNSYQGTGSTWYDLSGNGYNGNIQGASFSESNGGSFSFTSANHRIDQTGLGLSFASFSIESVIRPSSNDGGYNAIISSTLGSNNDYQYGLNWDLGTYSTTEFSQMNLEISRNYGGFYIRDVMNSSFSFGIWTHVLLTVDHVNNNFIVYVNGSQDYTAAYNGTITYFDRISIGQRFYANQYQAASTFQGNIALTKIYNRVLSANEVQQNYNATKGRFGL